MLVLFAGLYAIDYFYWGPKRQRRKVGPITGHYDDVNIRWKEPETRPKQGAQASEKKEEPAEKEKKKPIFLMRWLSGCYNYVVFKPNPLVQIFYLVIAGGGFIIYFKDGFKYLPNAYLGNYHRYTGSLLIFLCYYSFYLACTVDPGIIKDKKAAK